MVLSRGNREGGLLISLFPSPIFPPPFYLCSLYRLASARDFCLPHPLPCPSWVVVPNPLWTSPPPPASWPHCLAKAGPPGWNRWTETRAWGGGGGGEAEPASAGKGEQFWENKHEGGAWEKVAGRGRLRALLRGARAGMEWGGPWGGPQGWAPVLKAGSNAGWLRRSGLTSPPRWPPG